MTQLEDAKAALQNDLAAANALTNAVSADLSDAAQHLTHANLPTTNPTDQEADLQKAQLDLADAERQKGRLDDVNTDATRQYGIITQAGTFEDKLVADISNSEIQLDVNMVSHGVDTATAFAILLDDYIHVRDAHSKIQQDFAIALSFQKSVTQVRSSYAANIAAANAQAAATSAAAQLAHMRIKQMNASQQHSVIDAAGLSSTQFNEIDGWVTEAETVSANAQTAATQASAGAASKPTGPFAPMYLSGTTSIDRDGVFDFGMTQLNSIADPTLPQQAATMNYVDTRTASLEAQLSTLTLDLNALFGNLYQLAPTPNIIPGSVVSLPPK